MKQPLINIKDVHGKDYGNKPIISLNWNLEGNLSAIEVDFMGKQKDRLNMWDYENTGVFKNNHGNLIGKLL